MDITRIGPENFDSFSKILPYDTPPEEDGCNDQIRISESADGNIAQKEQDQQRDRNIQDTIILLKCLLLSDITFKTDKAIYIIEHQRSAAENHAGNDSFEHWGVPPSSVAELKNS